MPDSSEPTPLPMCTSCGSMQEGNGHFCEKCGAPLTQHAHSDYVLGIQSRGFALHQATTNPKKLIVVLGIWLWVGPSLAFCLFLFVIGLVGVFQGEGMASRILIAASGVGIALFGTILFRTTTAWLEQRSGASRTSAKRTRRPAGMSGMRKALCRQFVTMSRLRLVLSRRRP